MSRVFNRSVDAGYFDIKRGDKPSVFLKDAGNIEDYYQHIREVEKIFDEALRSLGIRFSAKDILGRSEGSLRGEQWISRFLLGETKGRVWPTQILTTVDILRGILENPGRSGVCVGATQCGKTGTSNNCNWLAPILQLITGQPYILITLIPRNKSLADQTSAERASFLSFYGDAELRFKGDSISLKRYFTQLYHTFPPTLFNPSDPESNSSKSKANVIRRVTGVMMKRLERICEIADELGVRIIFVVDESHYGAAANSVQDLMLNSPSAQVISGHHGHIMIGFSATPWEHLNLTNLWEVRHRLGYKGVTTYVGFNFLNGSPIDATVKIKQPNVMTFAEYGELAGVSSLEMVVPGWYKSIVSYTKAQESQRAAYDKQLIADKPNTFEEKEGIADWLPDTWEEYKDLCHNRIAELLNYSLVDERPFGGRGAILRFVNENKVMTEGSDFDLGLRAYLNPKIRILYYMQGKNEDAVERAINLEIPKNQPYVVIVTGSGRMGDLFPPEVKYGFEFARDIQLTPLQQGIPGRITGHNKESEGGTINNLPVVVLSPRPKQVLDEFIRSNGKAVRRPNNRVINGIIAEDGMPLETRGAGEHNITIFASDMMKDEFLKVICNRINAEIVSKLKRNAKMPSLNQPFIRLDRNDPNARTRNLVPIWEIVTDDVLEYIEENYEDVTGELITKRKVVLLRPSFNGEAICDDTGYSYACRLYDGQKYGRVGFRNVKLPSNIVGGTGSLNKAELVLPNDTLPASGNKASINGFGKQIDLQIHVINTKKGWELAALRLRCVSSFKSRVIGGTLPTDRAYTKGFRSFAETKALKRRMEK